MMKSSEIEIENENEIAMIIRFININMRDKFIK